MPELPEVETVVRGLHQAVAGNVIERVELRRANLRYPFPEDLVDSLTGAKIEQINRRAKFLMFDFSSIQLVGHLGMTGAYVVRQKLEPQKHDHMIWYLSDGREVVYHDPRRFGFLLTTTQAQKMLDNLGVEPFSPEFNADFLRSKMQKATSPIKVFLLNQKIVVGIGNIYASEILFRCSINPITLANQCVEKAEMLVEQTKQVLNEAILSGGSTLRNYANTSGEGGYFQHHFNVYGKAGQDCEICQTPIIRITQAGRSTFFCPNCQP
jgi:formamidopyrimidine-DNA glycosylase